MGRRLRVKGYAQRDEDDCGIQMAGNSNSRINNGLKYVHTRTRKSTVLKEHLINKGISQSNEIFPLWFPWILFPLILCIRLSYILKPTNWWILHPDEIFQTMEVAHTDVFGYGFRPYEYLPPPSQHFLNSTMVSSANAHDIQHGMFSLRSFLLPKLLVAVLTICNLCGVDISPFLIVKIFHVAVTSLLPVAVYNFGRSLQQSRDVSCLSATLVCSSLTLNIFGTHTFINSFLAPFFFFSLIPLINSFNMTDTLNIVRESKYSHIDDSLRLHTEINSLLHEEDATGVKAFHQNVKKHKISNQTSPVSQHDLTSYDVNANNIDRNRKVSDSSESGYEQLEMVFNARKQTKHGVKIIKVLNKMFTMSTEILSGVVLALCIYIRIDLSIILFLLIAKQYVNDIREFSKSVKSNKQYFFGVISGIILGGYCDCVTYGRWFLAPYQWYKFNILNSFAGKVFGIESVYFYLLKLFQCEPLTFLSFTIIFIDIIQDLKTQTIKLSHLAKNQNLVMFILLLLAYSCNSHKELRFIHNAVIFMYMSVSVAILSLFKRFSQNQNSHQYYIYSVYIFIALFTSSHMHSFYNMKIADRTKWTYDSKTDSYEINICLDYIRQQNDVSGVFMDRSVHMSGAYSILHHDVQLFTLNIFEFMEYKSNKHWGIDLDMNLSPGKHKGFSTFKDISDFISIYNTQYLHRKIRETPIYNFLILQTNTNFNDAGYDEVFRTGNSKVLLRTFEKKKEIELDVETAKGKLFLNATILEYEGSWLKHYGLYTKAEQRLLMANKINPRRIKTFRILLEMYSKLKHIDDYNSVLNACLQLYSSVECTKPYAPIELHHGYYKMP